jgi:hypothetical protein
MTVTSLWWRDPILRRRVISRRVPARRLPRRRRLLPNGGETQSLRVASSLGAFRLDDFLADDEFGWEEDDAAAAPGGYRDDGAYGDDEFSDDAGGGRRPAERTARDAAFEFDPAYVRAVSDDENLVDLGGVFGVSEDALDEYPDEDPLSVVKIRKR